MSDMVGMKRLMDARQDQSIITGIHSVTEAIKSAFRRAALPTRVAVQPQIGPYWADLGISHRQPHLARESYASP